MKSPRNMFRITLNRLLSTNLLRSRKFCRRICRIRQLRPNRRRFISKLRPINRLRSSMLTRTNTLRVLLLKLNSLRYIISKHLSLRWLRSINSSPLRKMCNSRPRVVSITPTPQVTLAHRLG